MNIGRFIQFCNFPPYSFKNVFIYIWLIKMFIKIIICKIN